MTRRSWTLLKLRRSWICIYGRISLKLHRIVLPKPCLCLFCRCCIHSLWMWYPKLKLYSSIFCECSPSTMWTLHLSSVDAVSCVLSVFLFCGCCILTLYPFSVDAGSISRVCIPRPEAAHLAPSHQLFTAWVLSMDDGDVLCQYAQNHIYCTAPVGLINYSATLFPEPDASVANIKVAPNSSLAQKLGLPTNRVAQYEKVASNGIYCNISRRFSSNNYQHWTRTNGIEYAETLAYPHPCPTLVTQHWAHPFHTQPLSLGRVCTPTPAHDGHLKPVNCTHTAGRLSKSTNADKRYRLPN